jgi:Flp pilus assembly secretin CpaC
MKYVLPTILVLTMSLVVSAQTTRVQQPVATPATTVSLASVEPVDAGPLTVVVGAGKTVNFREDSVRIALADDNVARVRVLSPREVMLDGLKPGRSTLFVWMNSGRRVFYPLLVEYNLEPARAALRELNPSLILDTGADSESVVLRGQVASESLARQARSLVEQLLPRTGNGPQNSMRIVNLIRHADFVGTLEDRLAAAMAAIDTRIKVRRIQSGPEPDLAVDSYILEGAVRDVGALVQAVVLADRQLGGTGKTVKAADDERVTFQRSNDSNISSGGGGAGGAFQGGEPPRSSISAQLARGLLVTSESGRVVSFLEVDSLPQISVAIRVLEIDRNKARDMGLDFRVDTDKLSIANITIPGGGTLSQSGGVANVGNVVGSYIGSTASIVAAVKFLDEKRVARSVAEPNVLTMSGEQASVLVGGEVPIPISSANQVSTQTGFSFQQFGVRLDIRPTVDREGLVTLEVAPSIVSPSAALGNGIVPGFRIQRVETTARVQAGESLILGGLLASNESVQERGIPILGKLLPIFRWKRTSTENTELLFVITPRLVVPPSADVVLPPLTFEDSPNRSGASGLDANGTPLSFLAGEAAVAGQDGACLEVRDRPTANGRLIDCLLPGVKVVPLEKQDQWRRVRMPSGKEGWALETRLQFQTRVQ